MAQTRGSTTAERNATRHAEVTEGTPETGGVRLIRRGDALDPPCGGSEPSRGAGFLMISGVDLRRIDQYNAPIRGLVTVEEEFVRAGTSATLSGRDRAPDRR